MARSDDRRSIRCSFCGKPQSLVNRLIAGNGSYICDDCVRMCMSIVEDGPAPTINGYDGLPLVFEKLPKPMQREFADVIQTLSESRGEISPDTVMEKFREEYLKKNEPIHFRKLKVDDLSEETESEFDTGVHVIYTDHDVEKSLDAVGNGPIDAVLRGIRENFDVRIKILDYEEHALQSGANSQAAAYIHMLNEDTGEVTYGVGVSSNITRASVRAIFSAINRLGLGA